jgi:hypothetical protein
MTRVEPGPLAAFGPVALGDLGRDERRQLCQALVVERGLRLREIIPGAEHDDLIVTGAILWRARPQLIRISYRSLRQEDVDAVGAIAAQLTYSDTALLEAAATSSTVVTPRKGVEVVRALRLVERMKSSPLISWTEDGPAVDLDLFSLLRGQERNLIGADVVGIRWLPALSRNRIPEDLRGRQVVADRLFEDIAFRLFTLAFRFGGFRLGARAPGTASPDAVLYPPGSSQAILLDCKATRTGYRMSASELRALRDYLNDCRDDASADGRSLDTVLILSHRFAGATDGRHPYYGRAKALKAKPGAGLAYMRADDLVRLALQIEEAGFTPKQRESLDWRSIFSLGMPTQPELIAAGLH